MLVRNVCTYRMVSAALAAAMVLAAGAAQAATRYWDGGTVDIVADGDGASQGGAGTWNTTIQNWDQGAGLPHVAWVNANLDDAVFGTSGGTVTLNTGITARNLTFDVAGYTVTGNTLTLDGATPTVTVTANATISSILAGSAGLTVAGPSASVLTLSATNTFSGPLVIDTATLSVPACASTGNTALGAGSGSITLQNGATLRLTGSYNPANNTKLFTIASTNGTFDVGTGATLTLDDANQLTLTGRLTKTGAGTLFLGGTAVTGAGGITVTGGTLTLNTGDANLGDVPAVFDPANLTLSGGTFRNNNNDITLHANRGITLGTGGGVFNIGWSRAITVNGAVTGPGSLTKIDSATLVLNGANNYAGETKISAGAVRAVDGVGLPTDSYLRLDGGVLESSGTFTRVNSATAGANNFQWMSGNGGGFSANGGKLTVTVDNNPATEQVWGGAAANNGIWGTLKFGSTFSNAETEFRNNIDLNNGTRTVDVVAGTGGDFATLSGVVRTSTGTGGLTKTGSGALVLSGANVYNGTTTLSAGTLRVGVDSVGSVGAITSSAIGTGGLTFNGGGLSSNGAAARTVLNPVTFNNNATLGDAVNNGKLTFAADASLGTAVRTLTVNSEAQFDGILGGAGGGITKAGAGTLTLAGNNTYTGLTTVSAGRLVLSGNNALATGGMTVSGGAAQFNSLASINGTTRNVTVASPAAVMFGPVFGAANIPAALSDRIVATSTGVIAADNQAATDFNFNAAGLASASFGAVGDVTYSGTLTPYGTGYRLGGGGGVLTMGNTNAVTGVGNTLTVVGTGTVNLAASNDYTGVTILDSGVLQLSSPSGPAIVGPVQMGAGNTNQPHLRMAAADQFGPGVVMSFANAQNNWARFDLQGTNQTLAGLNAGTASTLGGAVVQNRKQGDSTSEHGPATLTLNGSGTYLYNGYLRNVDTGSAGTNTLSVVKDGTGTQTLVGNQITYTGSTTVNNGTLVFQNTTAMATGGSTASFHIGPNGILQFNGAQNLGSNAAGNTTITGTGTLRKTGTGILGLGNQGNNTYKVNLNMTGGWIDIQEGTIRNGGWQGGVWTNNKASMNIASGATFDIWDGQGVFVDALTGLGTVDKNQGNGGTATLTVGVNNGTGVFDGILKNTQTHLALTKTGSGTQTLTNANTYTGATIVGNGTLVLSGNRTANSGAITVGNATGLTGTLNLGAGTFTMNGDYVVGTGTGAIGIVNQTGGSLTLSANQLLVGAGTSTGTYNLSAGSLTGAASTNRGVIIGTNSGSVGTFNLSGTGVLNMGSSQLQVSRSENTAASGATGTYNQTGGSAIFGSLGIGGAHATNNAGNNGTFSVTGGTFSAANFTALSGGNNSVSQMLIGGSADVTLPAFPTARGAGATATLTLDGGTLTPLAASTAYMGGLTRAYLTANGAVLNVPTGRDITIAQAFEDAPAQAGTLTKRGDGVLTLGGRSTYTGATTIEQGTLKLMGVPTAPVPGALYWLKADAGVVESGGSVSAWNDQTANGRNFTQVNGAQQPTLVANALNGLPVVRFDGANTPNNDRLVLGSATTPQSVFIVNQPKFDTNYKGLAGIWGTSGSDFGIRAASSTSWQTPGNSADFSNFGGSTMYINGLVANGFGGTTTPHILEIIRGSAASMAGTAIGDYWGSSTHQRSYAGGIGEVIVYDYALSAAERQWVEMYLMAKWFGMSTQAQLPSDTALSIAAGATFDMAGVDQTVGSLADYAGGGGSVLLGSGTLTVGDASSTTTFSGSIAGTGGLTKQGAGTLTLSGASTYTGATTVGAGTLLVNGSLGNTAVAVHSGGTLGGTGTIGLAAGASVTFAGGSFLAPGMSPGTLTVDGDLAMETGSTYLWELGPAGHDLVDMTGSLTLGDWTLALVDDGAAPVFGEKYYLFTGFSTLDLDGGSNPGNFNALFDFSGAPTWDAAYLSLGRDDAGLYLFAVPEPGTLLLLAAGVLGLLAAPRRRRR